LRESGVPGISGIDTRALTKKIRAQGALLGKIVLDPSASPLAAAPFRDPNRRNLVAEVSRREPAVYGAGNPVRVLAVDCGIKYEMIRMLVARGAEVKVVPWDWDLASERDWYDGLFISNGPGDPAVLTPLIEQLRRVITAPGKPKPVFGICLGNQLLGLAAGARSYKLPFGNRGHNQPVINKLTGEAFVTSQVRGACGGTWGLRRCCCCRDDNRCGCPRWVVSHKPSVTLAALFPLSLRSFLPAEPRLRDRHAEPALRLVAPLRERQRWH
jgi:carbamoyl-phosphate synthase (ammonia)